MVPTVSCWPASVVAEVSLVSTSPRHSCLCAKKFALLGLMVGVSAKKFSLRTRNAPKLAFCGVLGEFFAKRPLEGACRAKFFAGEPVKAPRWANFFAPVVAKVVILTDFRRKEAFFE